MAGKWAANLSGSGSERFVDARCLDRSRYLRNRNGRKQTEVLHTRQRLDQNVSRQMSSISHIAHPGSLAGPLLLLRAPCFVLRPFPTGTRSGEGGRSNPDRKSQNLGVNNSPPNINLVKTLILAAKPGTARHLPILEDHD